MLVYLGIRNLATVETLELEPLAGLTVITGETGAGKSVVMSALGLALGERAESIAVRHGEDRAEVQAQFTLQQCPEARQWLADRELDQGDECLLRRTITNDGRSRGYVNGTPTPLQDIRELGEKLVLVHSQHQHQALLHRHTQRSLLDNYAGTTALVREIRQLWQDWQQAKAASNRALEDARAQHDHEALLRFQLEELEALAPVAGELAELEAEQKRLAHAETLIHLCEQSLSALYEGEQQTVHSSLDQVSRWLEQGVRQDHRLSDIAGLLQTAAVQIETAADDLRHYLQGLEMDPERLRQTEERLSALFDAARKYRIRPEDLPAHHQALHDEAHRLAHHDEYLAGLQAAEQAAAARWHDKASALSHQRQRAARKLSVDVERHLKTLSMATAGFQVALTATDPGPDGLESVEFHFSANPGQPPRPLAKVASGGELSRISLAIQVICARNLPVPTLVFDEVDVGVGGGTADIVGRLLRDLAAHAQVLCITHQPQVAAQGQHHWHVVKEQHKKVVRTRIISLDEAARIEELARMLGGIQMTESTLNHARDMLRLCQSR